MNRNTLPIRILVADDDADDRLMIKDAFEESRLGNPVDFVEDGVQLMEYLMRTGSYADQHAAMARRDREASLADSDMLGT